jgi:hypothetical protein
MHTFHRPYGVLPPLATEVFDLTDTDKRVRKFYEDFLPDHGRAPTYHEVMEQLDITYEELWDSLDQLHRGVQVMFLNGTESLIKMPPFAFYPTRHRVTLEDGRGYWAGCAGEASAFSMHFPGIQTTVESLCPDCGEKITSIWKDGALLSVDPEETVINIGQHPDNWTEEMTMTCEKINFFKNRDHIARWVEKVPDQAGAILPIDKAQAWVAGVAKIRRWDYDRAPDVVGGRSAAGTTTEAFRAAGADVSAWEKQGEYAAAEAAGTGASL